ncbi:hypothetical protein GCM10023107_17480 [Actinoplanes octamycinicus]|nr:hypothetical protein Aoc01nite_83500 [Actinoplanes octamycinicus]
MPHGSLNTPETPMKPSPDRRPLTTSAVPHGSLNTPQTPMKPSPDRRPLTTPAVPHGSLNTPETPMGPSRDRDRTAARSRARAGCQGCLGGRETPLTASRLP